MSRTRRGVQALEFGLVAPLLFFVSLAGLDLAWYFIALQDLRLTTYEAAEVAAQTPPDEDPSENVLDWLDESFTEGPLASTMQAHALVQLEETYVVVDLVAEFVPLIGIVPVPETLTATQQAQLEYLRDAT